MHIEFLRLQELGSSLEGEIVSFLDSQDASHPFQFPPWSRVENQSGYSETYCALLHDCSGIRWFALCGVMYPASRFLRPIRALTISRGPVCDELELMNYGLSELAEKSRRLRFAYIEITPEWLGGRAESLSAGLSRIGWRVSQERRSSLRLNLRREPHELLASFRKATRYEIKRSERQGVTVSPASNETEIDGFLGIYYEMARRKFFSPDQREHMRNVLYRALKEPDRGALLVAYHEGKLLGGAFICRAGRRCWYVWGAAANDDPVNVGHLVQWRSILWAKQHGCEEYDFGGYRQGVSSGPAFFKRGFCDNVVDFLPAHRYPVVPMLCGISNFISAREVGLLHGRSRREPK